MTKCPRCGTTMVMANRYAGIDLGGMARLCPVCPDGGIGAEEKPFPVASVEKAFCGSSLEIEGDGSPHDLAMCLLSSGHDGPHVGKIEGLKEGKTGMQVDTEVRWWKA